MPLGCSALVVNALTDEKSASNPLYLFIVSLAGSSYLIALGLWGVFGAVDLKAAAHVGVGNALAGYDFLNFITAYRVFYEGGNPYDPLLQNNYFRSIVGADYPNQLNLLYPPAFLYLFFPLFWLPYSLARWIWLLWSIFAALLAAVTCLPRDTSARQRLLVLASSLVFAPLLSCYFWGQVSAFLLLFAALAILALQRQQWLCAAVFLAALLIKPQVGLLAVSAVVLAAFRQRKWTLVVGTLTVLVAATGVIELVNPGIHLQWWRSLALVRDHAQGSLTPTLYGVVRLIGLRLGNDNWQLAALVISITMACLFLWYVLRAECRSLQTTFELGLILSLIISPYAWFQDSAVLLLPTLRLLVAGMRAPVARYELVFWVGAIWGVSLIVILGSLSHTMAQHHLFWFPLVIFGLYLFGMVKYGFITRSDYPA